MGELYSLKCELNLKLDLLDTPDFYWDRSKLEHLYNQMFHNLNVKKRTSVLNEQMAVISELMSFLSTRLSDNHHVHLEWYIILLICVEVVFEVMHFIERYLP